jgi:glycosyltransferase involved in cell wall biosynthesis
MEDISLICACKNRKDALRVSLGSWISFKNIKEIIIVDWSSDYPIRDLAKIDNRIKIIEVKNKKYFNQPQPLNLAASIATGEYILKVDCDYIINPYYSFFENNNYFVDNKSFLCGNCVEGIDPVYTTSPFFDYLKGFLLVQRKHFIKVGGFNENITKCYAFEDNELYTRLQLLGLTRKNIHYDFNLIHIPHPDKKRTENFEGLSEDEKANFLSRYGNASGNQLEYLLAQYHIQYNITNVGEIKDYYVAPKTKWNIIKNFGNLYIASEIE